MKKEKEIKIGNKYNWEEMKKLISKRIQIDGKELWDLDYDMLAFILAKLINEIGQKDNSCNRKFYFRENDPASWKFERNPIYRQFNSTS